MDSQFPLIILTLFSSLYDQAASNLGARLRFRTSQTRLSTQTAAWEPDHSSMRCSVRIGGRARSFRTRHGHSTLNPPPSRNISERIQRLALEVLFTGLSRPSASLLPKLPAARSHSPFPARSSVRWCRPTLSSQPPCCPGRVPWRSRERKTT